MVRTKANGMCAALVAASACADPTCPRGAFIGADGDGFGAAWDPTRCVDAPGSVDVGGDGDDTRADVSPRAVEDCGADDLDCDGSATDGATPLRFYWDRDGDGYGTEGATDVLACLPPTTAYVAVGGDCDPYDAARHPGQPEIPFNGLDDDCDAATRDDDGDRDGIARPTDCDVTDPTHGAPGTSFVDVTADAGLVAARQPIGLFAATCSAAAFGGAAAVADVDGDGDLYLSGLDTRGHLMRNRGDGRFDDVSAEAGISTLASATAAVFFDLEGDGDEDLFVASAVGVGHHLYVSDGTGRFREEASGRGASIPVYPACAGHFSVTVTDVDDDGDLDLHLPSWSYLLPIVSPPARTLLNDGTGHFTLAPLADGFTPTAHAGFASAFADADGDGLRDLFLAGDFGTSALFGARGTGPSRTFVDVTSAAGVGLDENGMGSALFDYDLDGDLDWFVTAIFPTAIGCYDESPGCTGNKLYRNRGDGAFEDVAVAAGVVDGGWGWGVAAFDADHDGDEDLVHATGFATFGHDVPAIRYVRSEGAGRFVERACVAGLRTSGAGRAMVAFDADGDLDLDRLSTEMLSAPRLFRNDATAGRRGVRIRLDDPGTRNPRGIGATIWVRASPTGPRVRRELTANSTFAAVGPAEIHVGLDQHNGPLAEVVVRWPNGAVERYADVVADGVVTLVRGQP